MKHFDYWDKSDLDIKEIKSKISRKNKWYDIQNMNSWSLVNRDFSLENIRLKINWIYFQN